jgi:hypothetical protein
MAPPPAAGRFILQRAFPYLLFAALALSVFAKFLVRGESLYVIVNLEGELGLPLQEPSRWFRSNPSHTRVSDNVAPLGTDLEIFNEGLHQGELRLWNPRVCCGYPIYADPMTHPFYPPEYLLHRWFPTRTAYELNLLLHLFFSGTAMYWLLGTLGRTRVAAAAGGMIWMLLGYNALWFSTSILAGVSVFGPLSLMALVRSLERRGYSYGVLSGVSMGLAILGSHPQHALHFFLFLLAWLLAAAFREGRPWAFPLKLGVMFVVAAVGVGLAAILTRLDTIANGLRMPGRDFDTFYAHPFRLLLYPLGLVFGKTYFPEPALEYEFTVLAGLGATTLALVGAIRSWTDTRARFLGFFGLWAFGAAFLYPVAALLQFIPILNLSPASRWIFMGGFCLAALSAFGLDALRERGRRLWLGPALVTAAFLLACLTGLGPFRWSNGAAIETALGFGGVVLAAYLAESRPRSALVLGFGAILFELLPPFVLSNWHVDPAILRAPPPPIAWVRDRETAPWRGTGLLGTVYSTPEMMVLSEVTEGNGFLCLYGVDNIAGFPGILPANYSEFGFSAMGLVEPAGRSIFFTNFNSRLLDLANLKYLFLPNTLSIHPPGRFRLCQKFGRLWIYENTAVLPRAFLAGSAVLARDSKEAVALLRSPRFDPRRTAILETTDTFDLPGKPPDGQVEWRERTSDRITLEVKTAENAVLVLSDTYDPGWTAEEGGRPLPLYRADVAFRAVFISAGQHTVTFRFGPESVRQGVSGSIGFLILSLAYAGALYRRERRSGAC